MSYGQWADNFQHSFPGGRFKESRMFGGNVNQFEGLQTSKEAKPIALATVVYNQNGMTWVIDESNNQMQEIRPLTPVEYANWKESERG